MIYKLARENDSYADVKKRYLSLSEGEGRLWNNRENLELTQVRRQICEEYHRLWLSTSIHCVSLVHASDYLNTLFWVNLAQSTSLKLESFRDTMLIRLPASFAGSWHPLYPQARPTDNTRYIDILPSLKLQAFYPDLYIGFIQRTNLPPDRQYWLNTMEEIFSGRVSTLVGYVKRHPDKLAYVVLDLHSELYTQVRFPDIYICFRESEAPQWVKQGLLDNSHGKHVRHKNELAPEHNAFILTAGLEKVDGRYRQTAFTTDVLVGMDSMPPLGEKGRWMWSTGH